MSIRTALAVCLLLAACAPKQTMILRSNDADWVRSEEGSFVVYRIAMSGKPPYSEIIVADEITASAFRSVVSAENEVSSLESYTSMSNTRIASLSETDKPLAQQALDRNLKRIHDDLQGHTAVIHAYIKAPDR